MRSMVRLAVRLVLFSLAIPRAARAGDAIASPRLARLQTEVAASGSSAALRFWSEVAASHAPLVEPLPSDPHRLLVTFLWRSSAETHVVIIADFADTIPHMELRRLGATDVWYRSLPFADDARFLYEFSIDDPAYPFVDGDVPRYPSATRPDPLNPRVWDFAKPQILSVMELLNAPSLDCSTPRPSIAHGGVDKLTDGFASEILHNKRKVWAYKPPGYSASAPPYPLLVFGASYFTQIHLPAILDDLIDRHAIRPPVVAFFDWPPGAQDEESGGAVPFGDCLAKELVPWFRERVNVTRDPRETTIGGASAGGFSAACVAFQHPEVFGNVISQSGAYWRGMGGTAASWSAASRDAGREGFAREIATHARVPVRFFLSIGLLETSVAFGADGASMLHVNRHLRDVLEAKGYDVIYRETSGGHDPYDWESALPDALAAFLAPAPKSESGK
ncbi:MAG: DUF3327 domain-containing protein [Planctomycetes bacterium]|nr:DUF3327 domain-containing protein [Planctomycetota bacterium]MBI3843153.1 DUF3327 domain-containing protein [Planctomycetota bacterium]